MPRIRLTAAHVESLRPLDGRRTDYADTLCPGLILRVSPSGVRSWSVLYSRGRGRAGRRTVRATLGTVAELTLKEARKKAEATIASGQRPPSRLTVSELIAQCLADIPLADRTRYEWKRIAAHDVAPALGSRPASDLERADVRTLLRTIAQRSPSIANTVQALLSRAYRWALEQELVTVSPLAGLRPAAPPPPRERILSPDELRRLVAALARLRDDWAQADATLLLLLTGTRRAAVVGMRASELSGLDGREALWTVPPERAKRKRGSLAAAKPHHVPLSSWAVEVIQRRQAKLAALGLDFDHLWPCVGAEGLEDRPQTWSADWIEVLTEEMRPAVLDAELGASGPGPVDPPWVIHSLRHTIATTLVDSLGVSTVVADLVLGHQLPGTAITRRYVRAEMLAERRAALDRWAAYLERLAEPAAAARVLPFSPSGVAPGV